MASVNDKRKAAGTGGGKRSASGATYSQNKTVGTNTTPQERAAASKLNNAQREVVKKLGLSAEQALMLDQRRTNLILSNVDSYSLAQRDRLKQIYANVAKDERVRSGSSGMNKVELMEYKSNQNQKSTVGEISKAYSGPDRDRYGTVKRSNISTLRTYNANTKKWEISANTLKSISSRTNAPNQRLTQTDYKQLQAIAIKPLYGASPVDIQKINLARAQFLGPKVDPIGNNRKMFDYVDKYGKDTAIYRLAFTKIDTTNTAIIAKIKAAREEIIAHAPKFDHQVSVLNKVELAEAFKDLDSGALRMVQPYSTVPKQVGHKLVSTQEFKPTQTAAQIKQAELNKALKDFAGDSKLKQMIADVYNGTKDYNSLKKSSKNIYEKSEKAVASVTPIHYLDERVIEKTRVQIGKSLGVTEEQEAITQYINKSPALSEVAKFSKNKYADVRNKPLKTGAELAELYYTGKVLGGIFKGAGKLSKAGVTAALGKKAAQTTVKGAGVPILKSVPFVNRFAAQNLPMLLVDQHFIRQIGSAYRSGIKVDGETQLYGETRSLKSLYNDWKAGKKVNPITADNLKLTETLAIMGLGAKSSFNNKGKSGVVSEVVGKLAGEKASSSWKFEHATTGKTLLSTLEAKSGKLSPSEVEMLIKASEPGYTPKKVKSESKVTPKPENRARAKIKKSPSEVEKNIKASEPGYTPKRTKSKNKTVQKPENRARAKQKVKTSPSEVEKSIKASKPGYTPKRVRTTRTTRTLKSIAEAKNKRASPSEIEHSIQASEPGYTPKKVRKTPKLKTLRATLDARSGRLSPSETEKYISDRTLLNLKPKSARSKAPLGKQGVNANELFESVNQKPKPVKFLRGLTADEAAEMGRINRERLESNKLKRELDLVNKDNAKISKITKTVNTYKEKGGSYKGATPEEAAEMGRLARERIAKTKAGNGAKSLKSMSKEEVAEMGAASIKRTAERAAEFRNKEVVKKGLKALSKEEVAEMGRKNIEIANKRKNTHTTGEAKKTFKNMGYEEADSAGKIAREKMQRREAEKARVNNIVKDVAKDVAKDGKAVSSIKPSPVKEKWVDVNYELFKKRLQEQKILESETAPKVKVQQEIRNKKSATDDKKYAEYKRGLNKATDSSIETHKKIDTIEKAIKNRKGSDSRELLRAIDNIKLKEKDPNVLKRLKELELSVNTESKEYTDYLSKSAQKKKDPDVLKRLEELKATAEKDRLNKQSDNYAKYKANMKESSLKKDIAKDILKAREEDFKQQQINKHAQEYKSIKQREQAQARNKLRDLFNDEKAVSQVPGLKFAERAEQILTGAKKWGRNVHRERLVREEAAARAEESTVRRKSHNTRKNTRNKTYTRGKRRVSEVAKPKQMLDVKPVGLVRVKSRSAVKPSTDIKNLNSILSDIRLDTSLANAETTANAIKQAQAQAIKLDLKQAVKQKTRQRIKTKTVTPEPFRFEPDVIVPPIIPKRKTKKASAEGKGYKLKQSKRLIRNKLGSFDSILGGSAKKPVAKKTVKRVTKPAVKKTVKR